MNHLLKSFGDVSSFLDKADLPSSKLQLQEILSDPPKNRKLHMELVITVDAMEPFVKATYRLEGDGPLMLKAYEEIATLSAWILNQHYPNTKAVAKTLTTERLGEMSKGRRERIEKGSREKIEKSERDKRQF